MVLFVGISGFLCLLGLWTVSIKEITHASRKRAEQVFMWTSLIIMVVVCGCRGLAVGNDTPMYVTYFQRLEGLKSFNAYNWRFEAGFRLFNCLIAQFFSDAHVLLLISAILTLTLLFRVFKKASPVPVYSVMLFYGVNMYYSTLTMVRQFLAVVICAHAILYLIEKKRLRFVILTVIGGLFHTTAYLVLILLVFSLIPYRKNKRFVYILLAFLFSLTFRLLIVFLIRLMPRYASYLTGENYYLAGKLGSVIRALIFGLFFWIYDYLYKKYGEDNEKNKIMYFTGMLGFFITLISIQGAVLSRIALYFNIMFCVSIPSALSWIPDRKKKYIWATAILVGAFAYNFTLLIFRPYWTGILPYTFWN